jgi:hypothetical protein
LALALNNRVSTVFPHKDCYRVETLPCCQGTIMSKKSGDLASAAMALLAERFPRCFDERNRRPLKIGINADVVVAMAGTMTARDVANALRFYTGSILYQRVLTAGCRSARP